MMQQTTCQLEFGWTSRERHTQYWFRTLCFATFLFCLCSVHGGTTMLYEEIEKLGNGCPDLDSCTYQRTPAYGKRQTPIKDHNCNCDLSCTEYGDCCIDAWKTKNIRNNLKCRQVEQIGGVYMTDTCPPSYKGPEEVRVQCEKTTIGNQADPLGSMPVTDPVTGLTYKNYYCNMCNGKSDNIVMWSPKLECPLLNLMNASGTITSEYVLQNLVTDGHVWGLYLNDEDDGSLFFHDCNVYPVLPPTLESKIRLCKPRLISDCPPSWNRTEIRTMCKSYTGIRYDREGNAYRNVHCAICNGVNATNLSCQSLEDFDIFREFETVNFALLLDISRATGEQVGQIQICKRGEVFDPFFNKCRSIMCLPGFVRRGRRCMVRNPVQSVRFLGRMNKRIVTSSTTPKYRGIDKNATEMLTTQETLNSTLQKT